jgi:hypothetical protein
MRLPAWSAKLLALALAWAACSRGATRAAPAPAVDAARSAREPSAASGPDGRAARRVPGRASVGPEEGWTNGTSARLRVRSVETPLHDGSFGADRVELQSLADKKVLASDDIEGRWQVLAYAPASRAFVIGGEFEVGAWLPLDAVSYVDEKTGALRQSRYSEKDWIALSAVAGPGGRYVVFVGQMAHVHVAGGFRLQALDTAKDALYDLGPAPAPPPQEVATGDGGRCDWGDPVDGVTPMDPGIVRFTDAHTLTVSYGADNCTTRAPKRRVQTWDLDRVVASQKMVWPRGIKLHPKEVHQPGELDLGPPDGSKDPHF